MIIPMLKEVDKSIIYHYTTFAGLQSILENCSLWMGYIGGFNDYSEFVHGIDFFCDYLLSKPGKEQYKDYIEISRGAAKKGKKLNLFAVSFCKEGDLLNQWRAYANDGIGVSIGFDVNILKKICEEQKGDIQLYFSESLYEEKEKKEACDKAMLEMLDILKDKESDELSASERKELDIDLFIRMALAGLFFKNRAFKEEQEVRIATSPNIQNHLLNTKNIGNRNLVYYEIKFSEYKDCESIIKEVYLGPAAKNLTFRKALEILSKNKNGISYKYEIKESEIPYRSIKNY